MSKKFKGKLCAYCAEATSTTADHVFAREFFLPDLRVNLPKVPACAACNGSKSILEHYLTTVLPFGGRHATSGRNLSQMVPKRLSRNAKLHRNLRENWSRIWARESGIPIPVSTLPVDSDAVEKLFGYIARGLVLFHWGLYLRREHAVTVMALARGGEEYFDGLFAMNAAARVDVQLGDRTFQYEGAQAVDVPEITIWRIQVYGSLKFGDPEALGEVASHIGVFTGPASVSPQP